MPRIFRNVKAYPGRYDFTGQSNRLALDYNVEEKRITVLDSLTELSFPGLMNIDCEMEGLMNLGDLTDGGTYVEPILNAAIGGETPIPFSFSPGGADGDPACLFRMLRFAYSPIAGKVGDLHPYNLKCGNGAGRLVNGKVGLPKATYASASGNGTSFNLGALSSSQKLYAALHVFSVGAGGSVVVKIQSDTSGFPSPTDQATFTAATARTEEWKEVAGPVTDTFWRVQYTRTGGTDFVAAVTFGIGPA